MTRSVDEMRASSGGIEPLQRAELDALIAQLAGSPEAGWLDSARALILRNDFHAARRVLEAAVSEHGKSLDLNRSLAGIYQQLKRSSQAENLLQVILDEYPDDAASAFLLARMLHEQGRTQAMSVILGDYFRQRTGHDADLVITAIELLDGAGRQADAAAICEAEIASGLTDARLHAYAAMLQIQLGEFQLARARYVFAINHHERAFEWNTAVGLSSLQRYRDPQHGDFALFERALARHDLNDRARSSLLFAMGKAHDDLGDYAHAAHYFREANALVKASSPWSRKTWHNAVTSRLTARSRDPLKSHDSGWSPLFIVGVPRSGTTLTAELLSRYSEVCNRGELQWLPKLAQNVELSGHSDLAALEQAKSIYESHLLQDDGCRAKWFIDKEPLNLLRVDLIMAMYPQARIIFCERNPRDTALSLWSQYFTGGTQGYAYDLADIRAVLDGCRRMKSHWLSKYPDALRVLKYEELASDPALSIGKLASWLELPRFDHARSAPDRTSISTASVWQARQPVYTSSIGRWSHYVPYVPDLLKISEI